ncbi:MAG: VOC family protein [Pseudomonadota bacterium]
MKMYIKSVMVEDQQKALEFYTQTLGFEIKHNIPLGEHSWLTLVSKNEPNGVELALEPNQYPAAKALQRSLMEDGIPWTAFSVDDLDATVKRLENEGVTFIQPPMKAGEARMAVFDDTCGNLIQLIEPLA